MKSQATAVLSPHSTLFPPPLHIRKKSRKATIHRRILRKSSHQPSGDTLYGPLDDIIDEISGDIWQSQSDSSLESSSSDWDSPLDALANCHTPLRGPSLCAVVSLPISRTPSDHPLTIRKSRNSRSTASGSSAGFSMAFLRGSRDQSVSVGGGDRQKVSTSLHEEELSWPLPSVVPHTDAIQANFPDHTVHSAPTPAQQSLGDIQHADSTAQSTKRRISRLRMFTHRFPRLRRGGTTDTAGSNNSSQVAVNSAPSPPTHDNLSDDESSETERFIDSFLQKRAHRRVEACEIHNMN